MYAEHRYAPRQSRTVSLGAAFLINGALIAGLIYSAPNIVPGLKDPDLKVINIVDPPVPEPIDPPKPQPKAMHEMPRETLPVAPDTVVKTASENPVETGRIVYDPPPPFSTPPGTGDGAARAADPAPPLPPLIGASQDSRYLRDFQPPYPSAELRAQRDGVVSLKVLIGIDGRVKAVESLSATSDAFFEATRRQALSKWRFKPAARGGIPQESWKTMTVRFLIEDQ